MSGEHKILRATFNNKCKRKWNQANKKKLSAPESLYPTF